MARKLALVIEQLESRLNLSTVLNLPNSPGGLAFATDQAALTTTAPIVIQASTSTPALSPLIAAEAADTAADTANNAPAITTGDLPPATDAVNLAADNTAASTNSLATSNFVFGSTPDVAPAAALGTDPIVGSTGSSTTLLSSGTTTVNLNSYSSIYACTYLGGSDQIIGWNRAGVSSVTYTVNAASAGTYKLNITESNGSTAQPIDIYVNNVDIGSISATDTGGWSTYTAESLNLNLASGTSTICFQATGTLVYNLGSMSLTAPGSTTATTTTSSSTATATNTATSTSTTTVVTPPATTTSSTNTTAPASDVTISSVTLGTDNQLNIVGKSANDSISVTQSGSTLIITANGVTSDYAATYGTIAIYGGGGNDVITVNSSVTIDTTVYGGTGSDTIVNKTSGQATIVTIGDSSVNHVTGNGSNTDFWIGSSDVLATTPTAGETVHRVSSFYNGVSTSLDGQSIADPTGTGKTVTLTGSFWGTGPVPNDVIQGQVADCYLLATLQSMAQQNPVKLQSYGVDLGDGTYAVEFFNGSTPIYVRVDGSLPANGPYAHGLMYAHPGATGDIWAPIFEKAYAEYAGSMSYANINYGWMSTVLNDFGIPNTSINTSTDASIYATITAALASDQVVTIGTLGTTSTPLIAGHAYSVVSAYTSNGTTYYVLRNPWGFDGSGNDGNPSDGLVTITANQLRTQMSGGVVSLA